MKTLTALALLAYFTSSTLDQDPVEAADSQLPQHQWLQQYVGEWDVTNRTIPAPGEEAEEWTSTQVVRCLGGIWIVSETEGADPEAPYTTQLTLGYDPELKRFVGSWIGTMQAKLWTLSGTLNENQSVLTLESRGQDFRDPTRSTNYREQIEFHESGLRSAVSSMLVEDGSWMPFAIVEARRRE